MKMVRFWPLQHEKKRRLPLRLRLALWSAGLVLILSFALLLFINTTALERFPRTESSKQLDTSSIYRKVPKTYFQRARPLLRASLQL